MAEVGLAFQPGVEQRLRDRLDAGAAALCLGTSVLGMVVWGLWLPPAAPLVGIVLAYILWGWRRLEALAKFFQHRVQALNEVSLGPQDSALPAQSGTSQGVDFQTDALDHAIDRLVRAHAMEQRTQRQRDEWLRFLSHDLRSPQVSILSLLALWRDRAPGVDAAHLADGVEREALRTLELAEGFVDLTSADSSNYQFTECLAGVVVQDAIDQIWPYATSRKVVLVSRLSAGECVLQADMPLLTRAIVNLLNNAIRHSEEGGRITVGLEHGKRKEYPEVVLSVQDEGEGMTPEQLNAVLSALPGQRRRDPSVRGLGLGLAVVRAVVNRHGGWVHATSEQGHGSTFLLGLPLAPSIAFEAKNHKK